MKFFPFFSLGPVSTVLEDDEFGVFDERVGFLRVGYRYCPVLRAVDKQRGDGDFVQPACHVAAQAIESGLFDVGL